MEQNAKQKNAIRSKMPLKTIAKIGILGAIAAVLMLIGNSPSIRAELL